MNVSVRLSVGSLSRLYLKDYTWDRFQILYYDSTDIEDVQRRSFD